MYTPHAQPRTVAVFTYKGGTGKTATTYSLGSALARAGSRVLLLDLDAQCNLSGDWLGATEDPSLWHVVQGAATLPAAVQSTSTSGLDIIAAHPEMTGAEGTLRAQRGGETWLARQLRTLPHRWDWILLDCAPGLGILTQGALAAAEWVLIPCVPRVLESGGIVQALGHVEETRELNLNPSLAVLGVLPVMVDRRTALTGEILEQMAATLGENLLETRVPIDTRLAEAPGHRKSIHQYAPRSRSALAYTALAQEVSHRVKA